MTTRADDAGVELRPEPGRVVARLFLPGESTPGGVSRTETVLDRVLDTPTAELQDRAAQILASFGGRHGSLIATLHENAAVVRPPDAPPLADDLSVVVGATFTAEYTVEGAALCNPSAVPHPDQTGLAPGQLRVLLSLRSIGESHLSSIQFCEAIIGPGRTWTFLSRSAPLHQAVIAEGTWRRRHLLRALGHDGHTDEVVRAIGQSLPPTFRSGAVEEVVRTLRPPLLQQPGVRAQLDAVRVATDSAYRATFPEDSAISSRVLMPRADEERQGMEDARFVLFTDGNGRTGYRATYTAYDGRSIASRLLTTQDFREFEVHRLTGPPARTKGMALFPRTVGGRHLALSRGDGESNAITDSADGLHWGTETPLHRPSELWEVVQSGNCGPPIETSDGWLVLTHGVGPMRVYSIGAILLDLDDPTKVLATLPGPLVEPTPAESEGYVPNVVYSCGGLVHDGILWIPHGVADDRIRVASIPLTTVLAAMKRVDHLS